MGGLKAMGSLSGGGGEARPLRQLTREMKDCTGLRAFAGGGPGRRRASLSHHLKTRLSHSVMRLIQSTAMPTRRET